MTTIGDSFKLDGREIIVSYASTLPYVVQYQNFLSKEECDHLMIESFPRLERSLTYSPIHGRPMPNPRRTSTGMFFSNNETSIISKIERRISDLVSIPPENGEGIQVLRYELAEEYKPHFDFFSNKDVLNFKSGGQRISTFIMYLHEPSSGGETVFPDANLSFKPIKGSALYFSYEQPTVESLTRHGGAPVISGEKWIATKWFHGTKFEV